MKQCLILDDSGSIRKVGKRILEGFGFGAATVDDPDAALAACRTAMPDCILVDWTMPQFDPVRFMARLRRLPGGDRPRVVSCVVDNDPDKAERARRAGAAGRRMKPFDTAVMRNSLVAAGVI